MYQHGRDLCESLWGDAFMTVEDQVEEEEGGHHDGVHGNDGPPGDGHPGDSSRPCGCLTLSSSDRDVMAALRAQSVDPEELFKKIFGEFSGGRGFGDFGSMFDQRPEVRICGHETVVIRRCILDSLCKTHSVH